MPIPKDNLFYGLRARMTSEQEELANAAIDYNVVISNSGSGTGKTTVATAALKYLKETKKIKKAFYIFAPVQEGQLGFLPGDLKDKEAPYYQPLFGALVKLGEKQPEKAIDDKYGWITPISHTFLRGTDYEEYGVIIDEAQNFTKHELKKVLTRFHDNCHIIVTGHTGQIDLADPALSGFEPYLEHFATEPRSKAVRLTHDFRGWISRHADSIE